MSFFIYLGLALAFISGISVGAFTTGYQQRGNFYSEQKNERKPKRVISTWTAIGALISFAIALIIYLVK
ncbi:DUF5316 family protein [Paenibacillus sp. FSL L8-0436]|uniref:DUF5316 family protein n=1 Tax=Paenibacillus sp. FSL L8-0436 TaxID=2954686 RepID=UPI003158FFED